MPTVSVSQNPQALYRAFADFFLAFVLSTVALYGRCLVSLSGGSTPKGLYQTLSREPYRSSVPWKRIHFFWGDERCVPPGHEESNYRLAQQTLLSTLAVPPQNVHRVEVEDRTPEQAAAEYEEHLRGFFEVSAGAFPRFDLILLGIGSDGHTASLFPGGPELTRTERLVTWSRPPKAAHHRITLTLGTINEAREIAFLVSGREKAEVLRAVLEQHERLPSAQVRPRAGKLRFFVDEEAAFGTDYMETN